MTYNQHEIEGQRLPWYLGKAYYKPYEMQVVYLPVPFNWVAAWIRTLYFFVLRGPRSIHLDRRERSLNRREKRLEVLD